MSAYIYRLTSKLVKLNTGQTAHVATYAYKPTWAGSHMASGKYITAEQQNNKWAFKSGCVAARRLELKSDLLVTLSLDGKTGEVFENPLKQKVFYDDSNFGTVRMPKVGDVSLGSIPNFYVFEVTTNKE